MALIGGQRSRGRWSQVRPSLRATQTARKMRGPFKTTKRGTCKQHISLT